MIKSMIFFMMLFGLILASSGCSMLLPGQTETDCEDSAKGQGVCGSPRTLLENENVVRNLSYKGEPNYMFKDGRVWDQEKQEFVTPSKGAEKKGNNSKSRQSDIFLKNRTYLPQDIINDTPVIRDMGVIRRIWLAPIKTKLGDRMSERTIDIVVRKADWVFAEDTPKRVKQATLIPTVLTDEVTKENHISIEEDYKHRLQQIINKKNKSKKDKK